MKRKRNESEKKNCEDAVLELVHEEAIILIKRKILCEYRKMANIYEYYFKKRQDYQAKQRLIDQWFEDLEER